jgi:hypothetical protein
MQSGEESNQQQEPSEGRKPKEKTATQQDLENILLNLKKNSPLRNTKKGWPEWPHDVRVIRDDMGEVKPILVTKGNICKYISFNGLVQLIGEHLERAVKTKGKFSFTGSQRLYREAAFLYLCDAPVIEADAIKPVVELSSPDLCFHRLDFDFDRSSDRSLEFDSEVFAELMGRYSDHEAFMAWVGSLFDPHADRQQYVWLYGKGRNGKSSIGRFLHRLLGPSVKFDQPPENGGARFWTADLLGKRLVIFADCNSPAFPTTSLFKSLSGEDPVRIEYKGQSSFTARLTSKFLFFSNDKPDLDKSEASMRRVIYIQVDANAKEFGDSYEDMLWDERKLFVSECVKTYEFYRTKCRSIPVKNELAESLAADADDWMPRLFQEMFYVDHDATKEDWVSASEVTDLIQTRRGKKLLRRFQGFLAERGFVSRNERIEEEVRRVYPGLVLVANLREKDSIIKGNNSGTKTVGWTNGQHQNP